MNLKDRNDFMNESLDKLFGSNIDVSKINYFYTFKSETPFWIKSVDKELNFENPFKKLSVDISLDKTKPYYTDELRNTLNKYNADVNELLNKQQLEVAKLLVELQDDIEENKDKYFKSFLNETLNKLFGNEYDFSKVDSFIPVDKFEKLDSTVYVARSNKKIIMQSSLNNLSVELDIKDRLFNSNDKFDDKIKICNDQVNEILIKAQEDISKLLLDLKEEVEENKTDYGFKD